MVEEFEGKVSLRLSVLAVVMSCLAFWAWVATLVEKWF